MKLLLILLTLLLGGCSTTQNLAPVDQVTAEIAVKTVLHLSAENIGAEAFSNLSIAELLDETSAHLPEYVEIPLFQSRLARWQRSVVSAYWQMAVVLTAHLDSILETLDLSEAQTIVSSKDRLATTLLGEQHFTTMLALIADSLADELIHSRQEWALITARYEIVRSSEALKNGQTLPMVTTDLTDHLTLRFVECYLAALANEEQLLRTTAVRKGSGSILEVFQ